MDDAGSLRSLGSSGRMLPIMCVDDPNAASRCSLSTSTSSSDATRSSHALLAIKSDLAATEKHKSSATKTTTTTTTMLSAEAVWLAPPESREEEGGKDPRGTATAERHRPLLRLACKGRPSVARLTLRGSPCAARLLVLHKGPGEDGSQLQMLWRTLRGHSSPKGVTSQLFAGSPSPMQIMLGYNCKCTRSAPSVAQMVLRPCRDLGGRSVLQAWMAGYRAEGEASAQNRADRAIIARSLVSRPLPSAESGEASHKSRSQGPESLLDLLLEGEEEGALRSLTGRASSLLRLFLSGKPPLVSLVLERKESAPRVALCALRFLLEGELTDGDSLARLMLAPLGILGSSGSGSGKDRVVAGSSRGTAMSLVRFLIMGEDEGKPSLLRLFLSTPEGSSMLVPESVRAAVTSKFEDPHASVIGFAQPLRRWIRENDLLAAGFGDLVKMVFEIVAELALELVLPGETDAPEAVAMRLLVLGNGSSVEPLHRLLLWPGQNGLYEIPTLAVAGVAAGLYIQAASAGQQHIMLRRWQERLLESAAMLQSTAHASSAWAQTAIRTARALAPGGELEVRFVEIAMSVASTEAPSHSRAERVARELFAGVDADPAFAAHWDAHFCAVLRETSDPRMIAVLEAARARVWSKAARAFSALHGTRPVSFASIAQDLEALLSCALEAFRS